MSRARDWAELLRVSALCTVPGDALAGAAATGARPNGRTALAVGASLCLYQAGMALNDWADREEDAAERPGRPIPSGRISPEAALGAAAGLTAAGVALAGCAGRAAGLTATALAGSVWAYDLGLKHTKAGPVAMAAARSLDLLLGAAATRPAGVRAALGPAAVLGGHTLAVTAVSRRETEGGSTAVPLAALAATAAVGVLAVPVGSARGGGARGSQGGGASATRDNAAGHVPGGSRRTLPGGRSAEALVSAGFAASYAATAGRPLLHAALNPSPQLTQRAVGGGIRAMIPLQAALAARAGAVGSAAALAAVVPLARALARKISPT